MILVLSIVQGKLMISGRVGKHAVVIRLELRAAGSSSEQIKPDGERTYERQYYFSTIGYTQEAALSTDTCLSEKHWQ